MTMRVSETSAAKHAGNWRKDVRGNLMRAKRSFKWVAPNCEGVCLAREALCRWSYTDG